MPNYTYSNDAEAALKNQLGATTHDELDKLQASLVAFRIYEIETGQGPAGQLDAAHLKAIHHHLFQDVFEWAGHTRDERVKLADGTVASEPVMQKAGGVGFVAGPDIAAGLQLVEQVLRDADYLRGLSRGDFAEQAADVMTALNAVHAFREGNGRTQRMFMTELAKQAGHDLDFSVVTAERMALASIAAHEQGDTSMMRRMFVEISDPARVEPLRQAIEFLHEHKQPWNDRYIATVEPGHPVELTMVGVAGENFMGHTRSEILIGKVSDLPVPRPERGASFRLEPKESGQRRGTGRAEIGGKKPLASAAKASHAAMRGLAVGLELVNALLDGVFGGGGAVSERMERGDEAGLDDDPAASVTEINAKEVDRRRRALFDRFGRDLEPNSEQTAEIEEGRKKRDRGRTRD